MLAQLFADGAISSRVWLTMQDDKVRPKHAELEGYVIRFDAQFPDGLEPGEEFGCRCTQVGLTDAQAEAYR